MTDKSISRFARNTVTLLETVRELKGLGIDVWFQKENIHSISGDGELLLSVLASFAQEESLSVSENCKWRIRNDFKEGRPNIGRLLGYRLKGGVFVIVPEEAEIVKHIFDDYLSGMGILAIRKKLLAQGVRLSKQGIHELLENEKYTGDLLLQKTFTENHITKRPKKNIGQLPMYYVQNAHEPIISREAFDAVQAEKARRARKYKPKTPTTAVYPLTGMIKCGICGANYYRKHAAAGSKYEKIVWICQTYNELGKDVCTSQQIPEDILLEKIEAVGGLDAISGIKVPGKFRLTFLFKDGSERTVGWRHPSRSESWTPEMKQQARERSAQWHQGGGTA